MSSGLFKMLPTNYSFRNHIYLIYLYEQDLTINNLQELICHKTHPTNQPKFLYDEQKVNFSLLIFLTIDLQVSVFIKRNKPYHW